MEDTCGRHDFLLTPCSQQTFDLLYPELGGAYHPSCFENLCTGLAPFGVEPDQISTTLNIFMNVWSEPSGELHIDPPTSVAGDRFVAARRDGPARGPDRLLGREVQRRRLQADRLRGRFPHALSDEPEPSRRTGCPAPSKG